MLARIEELENQVARLRTGVTLPSPKKQETPPQGPAPEEKPAPKEEKNPEPKPEKPAPAKKEKEAPKTTSDAPAPVAKWNLILDDFGRVKPALLPFMRGSTATLSGDTVTVTLTVGMFLSLVDGDETAKTVLLSVLSDHGVRASEVRFVSGAQKKNNDGQIEF